MNVPLSLWPEQNRRRTTAWQQAYERTATYRTARRRENIAFWMRIVAMISFTVGAVLTIAAIKGS